VTGSYVAEATIKGTHYQWVGTRKQSDPDEVLITGGQLFDAFDGKGERWHYFPAITEKAQGGSVGGVVEEFVSRFCGYAVENGYAVTR
jgi:hypothetical protein